VLLALVLEQQTELHPTQIMTDTGAYSDVCSGCFRLLGYQFCPRLADMAAPGSGGSTRRGLRSARPGGAASHQHGLIAQHWMTCSASPAPPASLVQATGIMRTLQVGDGRPGWRRPSAEVGGSTRRCTFDHDRR